MRMISAACASIACVAASVSRTASSCTCEIMIGSSASATKPPPSRIIFAAFEAAAMTLGSSTHMGTR